MNIIYELDEQISLYVHNNIKKNREQSSLILTHWTHKALEIPVLGQAQLGIGLKQLMGSQPPS
jgi:hypothetical protein